MLVVIIFALCYAVVVFEGNKFGAAVLVAILILLLLFPVVWDWRYLACPLFSHFFGELSCAQKNVA